MLGCSGAQQLERGRRGYFGECAEEDQSRRGLGGGRGLEDCACCVREEPYAVGGQLRKRLECGCEYVWPGNVFFFFLFLAYAEAPGPLPPQCGHSVCPEISSFKLITGISHNGNREKVTMASAGVNFSVVLTESGKGVCLRIAISCRGLSVLR